jgi:FRG domain
LIIERRVTDWQELNKVLYEGTYDPAIHRHRSTSAFRGVSIASYPLTNGLTRLGTPYPGMEQNLLKQFKKYSRRHIQEQETEWHWLSIAQHHGLPTRLLDWTYSPLVALHFATEDLTKYGEDGAVWQVNYSQVHDLLQTQQRVSLDALGSRIFSVDALAETIPDLESLDNRSAANYQIAVFFEPPALDDRIVNQFAYFSVLSKPYLSMDDWLNLPHVAGHVDAVKIVIPKELKWEARDKLDQSNMNERVLMTGLDGLCAWLKRHYKPV